MLSPSSREGATTLLAAICLGALPSLGASFLCTAVGYVTQVTGHVTCFFKLLLAFYLSSGLAIAICNFLDSEGSEGGDDGPEDDWPLAVEQLEAPPRLSSQLRHEQTLRSAAVGGGGGGGGCGVGVGEGTFAQPPPPPSDTEIDEESDMSKNNSSNIINNSINNNSINNNSNNISNSNNSTPPLPPLPAPSSSSSNGSSGSASGQAGVCSYRADAERRLCCHRARIYASALGLIVALFLLGELLAHLALGGATVAQVMLMLALSSLLGLCAGLLTVSGAVLAGSHSGTSNARTTLLLLWLGVAGAGLVCILAQWLTGFGSGSSSMEVRYFFLIGSGGALVLLSTFVGLDFSTPVNNSPDSWKAPSESDPLVGRQAPHPWNGAFQGGNAAITVFLFPFLPLLPEDIGTKLVLWKLFMDLLGPAVLLLWRSSWGLEGAGALLGLRVALVPTILLLLLPRCPRLEWIIVLCWDLSMFFGSILTCQLDARLRDGGVLSSWAPASAMLPKGDSSPASPLQPGFTRINSFLESRVRSTRLAHQFGVALGLLASGLVLYSGALESLGGSSAAVVANYKALYSHKNFAALAGDEACESVRDDSSLCAEVDEGLGSIRDWPCGEVVRGPGAANWTSAVKIFHYGANMGCSKLSAIGVRPHSARAAVVRGWSLAYGRATGFPTSNEEPGFGILKEGGAGCVHGIVHEIPRNELESLDKSEPGYALREVSGVIDYDGMPVEKVFAYQPVGPTHPAAPSRRYAGLLLCAARKHLSADYARQMACGFQNLAPATLSAIECNEEFLPLAASTTSVP